MATGDTYQTIAFSYRTSKSTVSILVPEVCRAIWDVLHPIYLKFPTENEWISVADNFFRIWNFPNCLGSIDGKHVMLQAPAQSGSLFFNYKKHFSLVLLAVCDATYQFTMVDIGAYGSQSDGSVLANSTFGKQLLSNTLKLPPQRPLPNGNISLPFVFLGDEAFPLKVNLMRPFPGCGLDFSKRIYNYRLSRARRVIENTFGILCTRFRIFRRPIAVKSERAVQVTKAACVLHNFIRKEMPQQQTSLIETNSMSSNDFEMSGISCTGGRIRGGAAAVEIRDHFKEYFVNAGSVPWQNQSVLSTTV